MNNLVAGHFDFRPPFTASNKNYFVRFACCFADGNDNVPYYYELCETICDVHRSREGVYLSFWRCSCCSNWPVCVRWCLTSRIVRQQSTRNRSIGSGVEAAAEYDMRCQYFTGNEMRYFWKLSLLVSLHASISPLSTRIVERSAPRTLHYDQEFCSTHALHNVSLLVGMQWVGNGFQYFSSNSNSSKFIFIEKMWPDETQFVLRRSRRLWTSKIDARHAFVWRGTSCNGNGSSSSSTMQ